MGFVLFLLLWVLYYECPTDNYIYFVPNSIDIISLKGKLVAHRALTTFPLIINNTLKPFIKLS